MNPLRWLSKFLPWADPYADAKRTARLTEAEAFAIARRASEGGWDEHSLRFSAMLQEEGEQIWLFATPSRGMQWLVKVRDRDGKVVSKERVGLR